MHPLGSPSSQFIHCRINQSLPLLLLPLLCIRLCIDGRRLCGLDRRLLVLLPLPCPSSGQWWFEGPGTASGFWLLAPCQPDSPSIFSHSTGDRRIRLVPCRKWRAEVAKFRGPACVFISNRSRNPCQWLSSRSVSNRILCLFRFAKSSSSLNKSFSLFDRTTRYRRRWNDLLCIVLLVTWSIVAAFSAVGFPAVPLFAGPVKHQTTTFLVVIDPRVLPRTACQFLLSNF